MVRLQHYTFSVKRGCPPEAGHARLAEPQSLGIERFPRNPVRTSVFRDQVVGRLDGFENKRNSFHQKKKPSCQARRQRSRQRRREHRVPRGPSYRARPRHRVQRRRAQHHRVSCQARRQRSRQRRREHRVHQAPSHRALGVVGLCGDISNQFSLAMCNEKAYFSPSPGQGEQPPDLWVIRVSPY